MMTAISRRARNHNAIAAKVYAAYKDRCAICGWQATPELISYRGRIQYAHGNEIHHILPVNEGGTDEWDNVILLCPNHHKQADIGVITRGALSAYTKPYEMTEEEKLKARIAVADAVASMIFE